MNRKLLLNPASMLLCGLVLGAVSRLFDIYFTNSDFIEIVEANILENGFLPEGACPDIRSYRMGDILVGIDLSSGEFHIEAEDIDRVIPVYDDLFVYRGLGKNDLNNFVLVAEYVRLTRGI